VRADARPALSTRLAALAFAALPALVAGYVMRHVGRHTIDVAGAEGLLPRWDLATHLEHGWLDYHLLVTGQVHRLAWDLWQQGYWPPLHSIYQIPFYVVLGAERTSGLWSSAAAFVLLGAAGAVLLWRQWKRDAVLAAALFVALLISSPFLLAYATVAMSEVPGALAQAVVLLAFVHYHLKPTPGTARFFAVSLTALFFVKYNYFLLLAVPLAIHEWLEATRGRAANERMAGIWRWTRRGLSTPTGALLALYVAALLLVVGTGGFEFHLVGRRVSIRSIGNSGHVVLYLLLARLWYLHRRRRIDWARIAGADPRARPLLLWFVLPVTVWLAAPYPNHLRDFGNLVFNRPVGAPTVGEGIGTYLDALRTQYVYAEWVLYGAAAALIVAACRYRSQPPLMRLLVLAVPLQLVVVSLHQTRFPRFLLLTVVLGFLGAAAEAGRWFGRTKAGQAVAAAVALIAVAAAVVAGTRVVGQDRFRRLALDEHYTDSETLRRALESIRGELGPDDRLVLAGQTERVSPALLRWELGPPSGVPCFPFPIGGVDRLDLSQATRVLVVSSPPDEPRPIDVSPTRVQALAERIERGDLVLLRASSIPDVDVALRLYGRSWAGARRAPCR
jgi:hypothetical protein